MIDQRSTDRYIIDTPESIEFGYDMAGLASRFFAALLDILLFATFFFVIYKLYESNAISMNAVQAILVGSTLIYCLYYILFETIWSGQTPGKRVMGIRVVQETGRPVVFSVSVIRNLVRLVDFFPMFYALGIIMCLYDKRLRRIGDIAAGTLVVRDRRRVTLTDLRNMVRYDQVQTALDADSKQYLPNIEALKANEMQMVQAFLLQRPALSLERRQRLAGQLAYVLFKRLGYSVPGDAEQFLQEANDQFIVFQGQTAQQRLASAQATAVDPLQAYAGSVNDGTTPPVSGQIDRY